MTERIRICEHRYACVPATSWKYYGLYFALNYFYPLPLYTWSQKRLWFRYFRRSFRDNLKKIYLQPNGLGFCFIGEKRLSSRKKFNFGRKRCGVTPPGRQSCFYEPVLLCFLSNSTRLEYRRPSLLPFSKRLRVTF